MRGTDKVAIWRLIRVEVEERNSATTTKVKPVSRVVPMVLVVGRAHKEEGGVPHTSPEWGQSKKRFLLLKKICYKQNRSLHNLNDPFLCAV